MLTGECTGVVAVPRLVAVGGAGCVSLADLIDGAEIPWAQNEMKPLLMAAPDAVNNAFGQTVNLRPDDFRPENQPEVVDAAECVAPREPHQ